MGNASITSFSRILASGLAASCCVLALSGCMTLGLGKGKQTAEADAAAAPEVAAAQTLPAHPMTPAEQLAASLNARAEAQGQKPGGYRDPMVRTANGQQMIAQQSVTGLYPQQPMPPQMMPQGPASVASAPSNIGSLVTQPTAVNANRSSIYAAPAQIMVNPDGTLAGPAAAYANQGAAPSMRSVYSAPAGMVDAQAPQMQPQPQMQQQAVMQAQPVAMPVKQQSSAATMPIYENTQANAAPMRPTADATPSRRLPVPGSKQRTLSAQEALTVARNTATNQGRNPSFGASIVKPGSGLPGGVALPPGMSLTPGMSASLKQPM